MTYFTEDLRARSALLALKPCLSICSTLFCRLARLVRASLAVRRHQYHVFPHVVARTVIDMLIGLVVDRLSGHAS